jgi:hypothetical protein
MAWRRRADARIAGYLNALENPRRIAFNPRLQSLYTQRIIKMPVKHHV